MRLSNQLNLYPKKVYKWHWDRKKRLITGAFEDNDLDKNYEPDSGVSLHAERQDSDLKLLEQSKSEECLKSTLINSDFNKEDKDQVLSESSKNDDEVVLQDMKDDLI